MASLAPVMMATASDMVHSLGLTTAIPPPQTLDRGCDRPGRKTSGMLWLIKMTGRPRACTWRISSRHHVRSLTPNAAVGLSMITTFLAKAALRATATPQRWPPEQRAHPLVH